MIRTYCELLPGVLPEKWGWAEPEKAFDLNDLQALLSRRSDKQALKDLMPRELQASISVNDRCETINWDRKKKPKATGSFGVRWCSKSSSVQDTHAIASLNVELGQVEQDLLVTWLKLSSVEFKADIGLMDVMTPAYRDFAFESGSATAERFYLTTHVLRHWLPDIFWGTVFGPPYVALFGKDRLLSAPAVVAEEIATNMVYIQLTDNIADVANDPVHMTLCRKTFKDYLGVDAFFEAGRGYDNQSRLEHGAFGDLFVTPKFELARD